VKVSVIVLNWNGRRLLADCLDSLAAQTYRDFEVVVVDNGSTDDSAAFVREQYPHVRLVALAENEGFAAGNNRGLESAAGEYIVTLNNDTVADPGFLTELVDVAECEPGVGMVAALLVDFFNPDVIDAAGIAPGFDGLGYCLGHGEPLGPRWRESTEVFGPSAGAALYRRKMIDEIGFFDEAFFAYGEDFDLAWRGRFAGWRCVTASRAIVRHLHSATSGAESPFTIYHIHRNKWYVLVKDWPARLLIRNIVWILATDLASFALAVANGRGCAALRARCAVLAALPWLMARRRERNNHRAEAFSESLFVRRGAFSVVKRRLCKKSNHGPGR